MSGKPPRTTFRNRLEEMVQALRHQIITGELRGGDYLPPLSELGSIYQLSINSVQKGLDQLAADSFIERIPRVGIRILEPEARSKISINFGVYSSLIHDADLTNLIDRFHAEFEHIHVQLIPLQYENYTDVVKSYFQSGMLDVVSINTINYNQFVTNEDHLDMFELREPLSGVYSFLNQPFTHREGTFAAPFLFSPVILCYNRDHFLESGLPEPSNHQTWKELQASLQLLNPADSNRLAFYFYPTTENRWPIFLLQSGLEFTRDSKGKLKTDHTRLVEAIKCCYDLIHLQKQFPVLLSEGEAFVEELFLQQKVSVMMTTYFNLNKLHDVDFAYDICPLPYVHVPKTLLVNIALALSSHSQQKDAAQTFIKFMLSHSSQQHIGRSTLSLPALISAAETELGSDAVLFRPSQYEIYRDLSATYAYLDDLKLNQEEYEQLLGLLKLYWMDLVDISAVSGQLKQWYS